MLYIALGLFIAGLAARLWLRDEEGDFYFMAALVLVALIGLSKTFAMLWIFITHGARVPGFISAIALAIFLLAVFYFINQAAERLSRLWQWCRKVIARKNSRDK
ncbi:hypothetical protein [Entomohabitans teleogrylli]|uniref:hypothetical protein n=1 Tax=Entomohabitans teleogrylli TaxID=1384589 RepID=UPI00073D73EF|nr:hypothetical protein [Entomohabitans teleogrylli]